MIITKSELLGILKNKRGAFPVTITAETEVKMKKTGNPYIGATKISRVNGIAGFIYENSVNNQRTREDKPADFEAYPRKWGVRLQGTPIVTHNDKYYLELKVERSLQSVYQLNGVTIDKEAIGAFLYQNKSSRQEVERQVILRDYSLDSVRSITMDGVNYEVV